MNFVRFNNQPCTDNITCDQSHPFCENSGWGDEEASVVCRSKRNMRYGIGGKSVDRYVLSGNGDCILTQAM